MRRESSLLWETSALHKHKDGKSNADTSQLPVLRRPTQLFGEPRRISFLHPHLRLIRFPTFHRPQNQPNFRAATRL